MAYSAVKGGREAVEEAAALLEKRRNEGPAPVDLQALEKRMGLLIDRIMGEAGLYAPGCAALALKQSEGSPEEAVFLLRAYRSTLSRSYRSLPLDLEGMRLLRRISAAFKDIPGGQFLGATYDYTLRLLNFDLRTGDGEAAASGPAAASGEAADAGSGGPITADRVSRRLQAEGLTGYRLDGGGGPGDEPWDITERPLSFPAPRPARLQALARADSGFLGGLAYAAIRGFGPSHPTVGELRTGKLEVLIPHPLIDGECIAAGEVVVTETESFFPQEEGGAGTEEDDPLRILGEGQGEKADEATGALSLGTGYGLVLGRNDTKSIAMSIMDYMQSLPSGEGEDSILRNQEFVLLHGDSLEMNGFISHLKLPHYVTFQSKLDRVRRSRKPATGGDGKEGAEA
jgi:alpha-D-ribose 1-methylphosphonate 5-triphosphate synthase subunit PhnI